MSDSAGRQTIGRFVAVCAVAVVSAVVLTILPSAFTCAASVAGGSCSPDALKIALCLAAIACTVVFASLVWRRL